MHTSMTLGQCAGGWKDCGSQHGKKKGCWREQGVLEFTLLSSHVPDLCKRGRGRESINERGARGKGLVRGEVLGITIQVKL